MLRGRNSGTAFTMIELTVVIMIILVLASMTLVGLSRAQKTAQQTFCQNNLRQIGTAIITYANQMGGGYLPDFSITRARTREQWVWQLDFIKKSDRYYSRQSIDKVVPPRMSPAVLRCPADVQLFVNSQSMLTSYWMHPNNSYVLYANITNRDETLLGLEGDALNESGNCGCRFHTMIPPDEVDTTHFGGGHILFANGTVKLFDDPVQRKVAYWEKKAGWR